jgi:hypothetical protein
MAATKLAIPRQTIEIIGILNVRTKPRSITAQKKLTNFVNNARVKGSRMAQAQKEQRNHPSSWFRLHTWGHIDPKNTFW